jgi:phosphatidylinositol alpha-1,6-mannosyltransferase
VTHLLVTQDYAPDLGGMARRHVELSRHFGGDGMEVSTVASPRAGEFDRGEPYAIVRQPFPFADAKRFVNQMRWARWIVRRCRRGGIRALHCGNIRPTGYAVWWAHRRAGVRYLVYVYGGDLLREHRKVRESALKRATARRILGDAAGIVAISEWSAKVTADLMRELRIDAPPPVAAIDLGTDPVQFAPSRNRGELRRRLGLGDAPLILTVARLVPHKGQDVAIRALAALSELPDVRYLVVGDGRDEPRLRELARSLGVANRVTFAGALSDDDVAEAYATASVYAGLSRVDGGINVEGFGLSFVEAGASGVPSVAGDSGGVRSAVRDGEMGLVVPPDDPAAVAAALRILLTDATRRNAMGEAARRAVETHYNWARVGAETRAFAERVLAAPAGRTAP